MSVSPERGFVSASAKTVNVAGTRRSSVTSTVLLENSAPVVKLYFRSTSQNGNRTSPAPEHIGRDPPFFAETMASTLL